MFHQSVQPFAIGKSGCHCLKPKQAVLCSVQPGRQSSAGKRRSSSSGDVGWPKAAWYLKGMGRYALAMHILCLFACTGTISGKFCDL